MRACGGRVSPDPTAPIKLADTKRAGGQTDYKNLNKQAASPDPTASITLADTKFSEGISSSPLYCRFFSCSMMSSSSGSTSARGAFSTLGHCT